MAGRFPSFVFHGHVLLFFYCRGSSVTKLTPEAKAHLSKTIRALRDEDFDVLHLHEPFAPGPTITAMLVKPAPIVGTFHSAGSSFAYDIFKPLTFRGSKRLDLTPRAALSNDPSSSTSPSGSFHLRSFDAPDTPSETVGLTSARRCVSPI